MAYVQSHLHVEGVLLELVAREGNIPCKVSVDRMEKKETGTLTETLACHEINKQMGTTLHLDNLLSSSLFFFFSFNSCEQTALNLLDSNSILIKQLHV